MPRKEVDINEPQPIHKGRSPRGERAQKELLARALSILLPSGEAKNSAGALIQKYGSLNNVLLAAPEDMRNTPGVDGKAADFVGLAAELGRAGLEEQATAIRRIFDTRSAAVAMRPLYIGRRREAIGFLMMDTQDRVLFNDIVTEGDISDVPVYVRKLVQLCIEYDAVVVAMAHNHPSGNPMPSRNDIVATRQVELALRGINVALLDHIIFGGDTYFSFAGTQVWREAQENIDDFFHRQLDKARLQEYLLLQHRDELTHTFGEDYS